MTGIAALVLTLGTVSYWFWRAFRVDIPASPRMFMLAWGTGLGLGLLALTRPGAGAAAWWAIGLSTMMLYLSATARQKLAGDRIGVGDVLPRFAALDADGNPFDSASLAGSRVLLKFFRGHW
ncbi:MAG: hypothetical protein AB7O21_16405 [Gammaproteobacteria bacterium]